jgi:hypothetical protein
VSLSVVVTNGYLLFWSTVLWLVHGAWGPLAWPLVWVGLLHMISILQEAKKTSERINCAFGHSSTGPAILQGRLQSVTCRAAVVPSH